MSDPLNSIREQNSNKDAEIKRLRAALGRAKIEVQNAFDCAYSDYNKMHALSNRYENASAVITKALTGGEEGE